MRAGPWRCDTPPPPMAGRAGRSRPRLPHRSHDTFDSADVINNTNGKNDFSKQPYETMVTQGYEHLAKTFHYYLSGSKDDLKDTGILPREKRDRLRLASTVVRGTTTTASLLLNLPGCTGAVPPGTCHSYGRPWHSGCGQQCLSPHFPSTPAPATAVQGSHYRRPPTPPPGPPILHHSSPSKLYGKKWGKLYAKLTFNMQLATDSDSWTETL